MYKRSSNFHNSLRQSGRTGGYGQVINRPVDRVNEDLQRNRSRQKEKPTKVPSLNVLEARNHLSIWLKIARGNSAAEGVLAGLSDTELADLLKLLRNADFLPLNGVMGDIWWQVASGSSSFRSPDRAFLVRALNPLVITLISEFSGSEGTERDQ